MLFVLAFGHVTVKNFNEILKKTLSHNFLWFNSFHVSTHTTIIQNRVPESGHATVIYFVEILKFRMFLIQTLSHIFVS